MDVLVIIPMFAAIFAPIVFIGKWILGPIDRAAKFRQAPVRFSIGDFLCLFLAVQIPLTAAYQLVGEDTRSAFWTFSIISWIIAPIIWFACARALSKAGVASGRDRFIFLGLVMPVVYYGLIPFVMLTTFCILTVLMDAEAQSDLSTLWVGLAWVLFAGVFFLCGVFTRWMLRSVGGGRTAEERNGDAVTAVSAALLPTRTTDSHWEDNSAIG